MNSNNKTDRRIIKTKKAIRNAFAELLSKMDIDEITITDIAETADINRKTFYNHYTGIYQLIDEIENEIISAFDDALRGVDFKNIRNNPYEIFKKLTTIINSDLDFYSHLMKTDFNTRLVSKIIQTLKLHVKKSFSDQITIDEKTLDLIIDYAASGMITVYQNWFNSGRTQSIEEISQSIRVMTFSGIYGILDEKLS
ncbi:MAG: TetR family transcriptional regulator [Lachnospiraceae bacterium]|nr:TetR family transcriptional regulator [Lachnospiraceae bacterium]